MLKFLSTVFSKFLLFHQKPGAVRNFLKMPPFFEVCYGAQAVAASASHEILHMRRRFSALSFDG